MERATFGIRALGAIIDAVILMMAYFVLGIFGVAMPWSVVTDPLATPGFLMIFVSAALVIAYTLLEVFKAQTPGKMALKLIIRGEDGNPASQETLWKRWGMKMSGQILNLVAALTSIGIFSTLGTLAGLVFGLGVLLALGSTRQTLHDKLAKTAVYKQAA